MSDKFKEFVEKYGAKKDVWEENLKFKYQNKSLREYTASVYGHKYQPFPVTAFTSEAVYLQWCIQVSGAVPAKRGRDFLVFIRDRLSEAEEEAIPPNTEEGIEIGVVVLTILKAKIRNARNFDMPQEESELKPGEWLFLETVEGSNCGMEVFIKYEGLRACILDELARQSTETKMARKDVTAWLKANGRYYDRTATVNRWRCAYVLPCSLVENFEVFALRNRG